MNAPSTCIRRTDIYQGTYTDSREPAQTTIFLQNIGKAEQAITRPYHCLIMHPQQISPLSPLGGFHIGTSDISIGIMSKNRLDVPSGKPLAMFQDIPLRSDIPREDTKVGKSLGMTAQTPSKKTEIKETCY